jgi:hypothetical protein
MKNEFNKIEVLFGVQQSYESKPLGKGQSLQ